MSNASPTSRNRGGRPAKFAEPRRPVTVTLPERILDRLSEIDADRARAIVKLVDASSGEKTGTEAPTVRSLPISDAESLLLVVENRFLRAIPWLTLVEVSPGRHLLALRDGATVERFELTLRDMLETATDIRPGDRRILQDLLSRLRNPRRKGTVRAESILVVPSDS